ncbi:MAG TPA: cytochrome c oxidase assembly protein [Hanamia sp.]|jgi:cytochrome c oxidase assembly factor CtaG|nr:cytochrome c oxidase assembly protein [Hanamia sp.]
MHSIFSYWRFDFITIIFLVGLCVLYFYTINLKIKKQSIYFFTGIFLLILCIASPLHFLGENYLFSAHMLSHVLIILIAAPLIVAGIPAENKFKKILVLFSKKGIFIICWFIGVGIMWLWHVPYIFNHVFSMQRMSNSHSMNVLMFVQMFSLLLAGIIFCWPIINPYKEYRITPITAVLYLSTACVFCSLLGLLITFATSGIYFHYENLMDSYGYLSMIRNKWKISAAVDQQIAGLIMWVPCCLIYLTASMILLIKWFDENEPGKAIISTINNSIIQ